MKSLFVVALAVFGAQAFASECIDARVIRVPGCQEGFTRIFDRGNCKKPYEIVGTRCVRKLECLDVRAADFQPCPRGQSRIFVQGRCRQPYEIEATYCQ